MDSSKENEEESTWCSAWNTMTDPARAAWLFSQELLDRNKHLGSLHLDVDIREEEQQQDNALVTFYKKQGVKWASPIICKLNEDAAVTKLFEGEADHLIPSISEGLVAGDVFAAAGRMMGHSFLHGGPSLPGISPAVVHVLLGGSPESAPLALEDCPDMDIRDSITLLDSNDEAEYCETISNLCMLWKLPLPNEGDRKRLSKRLLQHAVLGRTMHEISCLRLGLEETGVWVLLTQRPDVVPLLFPRESEAQITAHMILDHIVWPSGITVIFETYIEPENVEEDEEDVCRICGYLRMFIGNASSTELKILLKFWTGWEMPAETMKVEILDAPLPTSLACFEKLRLPRHYVVYNTFREDLDLCLSTVVTGFEFS